MQSRTPAPTRAIIVPSALAAALSLLIAPAHAASDATDLDSVVVTASRTAQPAGRALASVTVIDRARIERLQPASLQELLRGEAGVSIANNGGAGKQTSLFLRGTDSDHTLVLVDGLKAGSATSGGAAFQDIPVDQIERIEIARGPFSSLYGSDAIGGVIHIFTRRPATGFDPSLSVGAGSRGAFRALAGLAGRGENAWYSLQAGHETTDGIDAYRGNPAFAAFETLDPDRDGYRNTSVTARAGTRIGEAWTVEGHVLRADGHAGYDGFTDEADVVQQVAGARVHYAPTARVGVTLNGGRTVDRANAYAGGQFSSRFDTLRELGSLQADLGIGPGTLTTGFDWKRDQVDSSTPYDVDTRHTRGLFAQWQQEAGAHAFRLSARRDDDTQFGGYGTGAASWGWDFTPGLRLTANLGTAFKAPSFNELYFPGYGNPLLEPETSRSAELGLRGRSGALGWSLNAFETRIEELITHNPDIGQFGGPDNIERARIRGVETTAQGDVAGWTLRGSATWLDPRNDGSGINRGNVLPRRARHAGRIDVDRHFGEWSVGASVTGEGRRFDNVSNTIRMGGYATADLRLGFDFAPAWSLLLTASNVFDRRYETAAYYNQPGRGWFLNLRYRPAR